MKAYESAKSLFDEHKFAEAADRTAFSAKLDAAMSALWKQLKS